MSIAERLALEAAAKQAGEVMPAPAVPTVFAPFPFSAKVGM
jgi:hypothetical protein